METDPLPFHQTHGTPEANRSMASPPQKKGGSLTFPLGLIAEVWGRGFHTTKNCE